MIRNFMRLTFPKILDVLVVLSLLGVLIASIMYASVASQMYGSSFIITFIITLCLGVVGVIIGFGVIYALLDIRDSLEVIRGETKKG